MDMKKATILGICLAAAPLHAAATENADNDHLLDFSIEYSGEQVVGMTSYIYDTNNLVKEKNPQNHFIFRPRNIPERHKRNIRVRQPATPNPA